MNEEKKFDIFFFFTDYSSVKQALFNVVLEKVFSDGHKQGQNARLYDLND